MIGHLFNFRNLYILGLLGIAFSLSISVFSLSVSQFFVALIWILSGNFKDKWKRLRSAKVFWLFLTFYLLHLISLCFSVDLEAGIDDIRIKLPLLLIPLFIFSQPALSKKEYGLVWLFFVIGLTWSSVYSFFHFHVVDNQSDLRLGSHFISHIRLSLMIAICFPTLLYVIVKEKIHLAVRLSFSIILAWFLFYMGRFQLMTGIISLCVGLLAYGIHEWKSISSGRVKKLAAMIAVGVIIAGVVKSFTVVQGFLFPIHYSTNTLPKKTPLGHKYFYDFENYQIENGERVTFFVCDYEARPVWNKRATLRYDSLTYSGQSLRNTLHRYLTSKGYTKDSVGVAKLEPDEIIVVENGVTNYKFTSLDPISIRLYKIAWELHNYWLNNDNPSGNSFVQRFEFWKSAIHTIRSNWLFGVGTGDVEREMKLSYREINTQLEQSYWFKPHNQFLTTAVQIGICGLAVLLILLFYIMKGLKTDILGFSTWLILVLSMLTEDTIQTQIGVTMFVFLLCLHLNNTMTKADNSTNGI